MPAGDRPPGSYSPFFLPFPSARVQRLRASGLPRYFSWLGLSPAQTRARGRRPLDTIASARAEPHALRARSSRIGVTAADCVLRLITDFCKL